MTGKRCGARDRKSDHAGANHQNLHRGSSLAIAERHELMRPKSISAGDMDSGLSLRSDPE